MRLPPTTESLMNMKFFSRLGRVGCISPSADYVTVNQEMEKLVPASTDFGFSLLRVCRNHESTGNVFFSPFSISTALAMTLIGARGTTRAQMLHALHLNDISSEELEQSYQTLLNSCTIHSNVHTCTLYSANGMFVDQSYPLLEEFAITLDKRFKAANKSMDFQNSSEDCKKAINQWAEESTFGRVTDVINELDQSTKLVLVSTVYFKGLWCQPFEKSATFKAHFHISHNETTEMDMMKVTGDFNYTICPDLQCACLEMPYMGDKLSMMFILPEEVDGLPTLERKLNAELLQHMLSTMERCSDIQVYLPKFKVEATLNLENYLKQLGMVDIFSDKADLSGVCSKRDLHLSGVVHKAIVEVDEEGTDTAVASGVMIRLMCAVIPTEFVVNHPFMFLIRDYKSNNVHFIGSIQKP